MNDKGLFVEIPILKQTLQLVSPKGTPPISRVDYFDTHAGKKKTWTDLNVKKVGKCWYMQVHWYHTSDILLMWERGAVGLCSTGASYRTCIGDLKVAQFSIWCVLFEGRRKSEGKPPFWGGSP